jgi:hypothetical protein
MKHGTGGYRRGCRCGTCTDEMLAYNRARYGARGRADRPTPAVRLVEPTPLWHRFAACRPEYADRPLDQWVDMFFPDRGASTTEVKAICAECPAQEACLDQAMRNREHHGIWGSTSERERRRLRRNRGAA